MLIIFGILLLLILAIMVWTMVCVHRSRMSARWQIIWLFGGLGLCLLLVGFEFLMLGLSPAGELVTMSEQMRRTSHWLTPLILPCLMVFPLHYLLFLSLLRPEGVSRQGWWTHGGIMAFVLLLWLALVAYGYCCVPPAQGWQAFMFDQWFNHMLFALVLGYTMLLIMRFHDYKSQVCNFYADKERTDFVKVRYVHIVFLCYAAVSYAILLVGIDHIRGVELFGVAICLSLWIGVLILAHCLLSLRGMSLPEMQDGVHVDEETIMHWERALNGPSVDDLDDAMSLSDVGARLELWAAGRSKEYLAPGITLAEVADRVKVHPKVLSTYLNHTLHTNFNNWINSYRLAEARYLLMTTELTVEEVAEECGFADRSALTRVFKQLEGMSPGAYRRKGHKK